MPDTFPRKRLMTTGLLFALAGLTLFARPANAQYNTVQMSFGLTTAASAAVGAPFGYIITESMTGSTKVAVGVHLDVTAPDGVTVYHIYPSLMVSVLPGQVQSQRATFTTSTFTSQTGTFTVNCYLTAGSKTIQQQTTSVTVTPAPTNGIFASVGGLGPATHYVGFPYDFSTLLTNLNAAAQTVATETTLTMVDGTQAILSPSATTTINPGQTIVDPNRVTTSQYNLENGTFTLTFNVYDTSNNLLASATQAFTRNTVPSTYNPPTFTDKASAAGINVSRMPMTMQNCGGYFDFMMGGSGAAVADYDGDGYDDVYAVDMSGMGHLWHNNGNGTFTDMAMMAGIPMVMMQSGASWADIDNDGHPDLLILVSNGMNVLLHNNGDGTFTDISSALPMDMEMQNNFSATWGDFNNDGLLDLYITEHANCMAMDQDDHLYQNMGTVNGQITFSDVTTLLGGMMAPQVNGRGLVTAFVDYNGDGLVDLYVGNDIGYSSLSYPNVLWKNTGYNSTTGQWSFADVSSATHMNLRYDTMGIGLGDFNRDGTVDFYVTNVGNSSLMAQNSGNTFTNRDGAANVLGSFSDARAERGTIPLVAGGTGPSRAWSTGLYDFNNDGWLDIYTAGDLGGKGEGQGGAMMIANYFLLSNQDGTFLDDSMASGVTGTMQAMPTAVFADFNNDGFMDVFEQGMMGGPHLYINNAVSNGNTNWLEVKLVGTTSNRDGVGARVVANVNGVNLVRNVVNGGNYQGNSTLTQHFGLGASTSVNTLTVYWPSGIVSMLSNVPANQILTVTE